jgi:hypothetical protein
MGPLSAGLVSFGLSVLGVVVAGGLTGSGDISMADIFGGTAGKTSSCSKGGGGDGTKFEGGGTGKSMLRLRGGIKTVGIGFANGSFDGLGGSIGRDVELNIGGCCLDGGGPAGASGGAPSADR